MDCKILVKPTHPVKQRLIRPPAIHLGYAEGWLTRLTRTQVRSRLTSQTCAMSHFKTSYLFQFCHLTNSSSPVVPLFCSNRRGCHFLQPTSLVQTSTEKAPVPLRRSPDSEVMGQSSAFIRSPSAWERPTKPIETSNKCLTCYLVQPKPLKIYTKL